MAFTKIEIELMDGGTYEVRVTKTFDPELGGGEQTFKENGGIFPHRALDVARDMITVSPARRSL